MRILICATEYPPYTGGIGVSVQHVSKELEKLGNKTIVCSPVGPDIKLGSQELIQKFGIVGNLFYWHQVSKYFRRNQNFDIVWLHNPLFPIMCPFEKGVITLHTSFAVHNELIKSIEDETLSRRLFFKFKSKIESYCLEKVSESFIFTAVTPLFANWLESLGLKDSIIHYVPNGVDTNMFKPVGDKEALRKEFGIPADKVLFIWVGRMSKTKQPLKLLRTFRDLNQLHKDLWLVVVGSGPLLTKAKSLALKLNLKNTIFTGQVDHLVLKKLYACSNFYLSTSNFEGFPLTLLEAMSSELPPILPDVPSLRSFLKDWDVGLLVDFNDEVHSAKQIFQYITSSLPKEHASKVIEIVKRDFDWKSITVRYLNLFNRLARAP